MSKKINFVLKFTFFFLFSVFLLCSLMFLFTNKKILLQEMKNASYFKNLSISIKEERKRRESKTKTTFGRNDEKENGK